MSEYPLFPALSEEGKKEAQQLIDDFKEELQKTIDDMTQSTLDKIYCDVVHYIESDSWTNFRNEIMDGFKNYNNRKIQGEYEFKEIRECILKNHRDDIVADLNQDLLAEIESLKADIEQMRYDRTPF